MVDRHLHCLSPPATHSQRDILKDPTESHKLLQLAYSGLIGLFWCDALEDVQDEETQQNILAMTKAVLETAGHFFITLPAKLPAPWHALLQESNAQCWQLPGPHGISARDLATTRYQHFPASCSRHGRPRGISRCFCLRSVAGLRAALLRSISTATTSCMRWCGPQQRCRQVNTAGQSHIKSSIGAVDTVSGIRESTPAPCGASARRQRLAPFHRRATTPHHQHRT